MRSYINVGLVSGSLVRVRVHREGALLVGSVFQAWNWLSIGRVEGVTIGQLVRNARELARHA